MANNINKFLDKAGLTRLISWIKGALNSKQDTLVSGTNIKSINGNTLLGSGDVTIHEEQLIEKSYAPAEFSGLGRKYLQKNIVDVSGTDKNVLTQAMINDANTIYVIQYDYDLNGASITVPSGCVLQFDGGSLNNGTMSGSAKYIGQIQGNAIFSSVPLKLVDPMNVSGQVYYAILEGNMNETKGVDVSDNDVVYTVGRNALIQNFKIDNTNYTSQQSAEGCAFKAQSSSDDAYRHLEIQRFKKGIEIIGGGYSIIDDVRFNYNKYGIYIDIVSTWVGQLRVNNSHINYNEYAIYCNANVSQLSITNCVFEGNKNDLVLGGDVEIRNCYIGDQDKYTGTDGDKTIITVMAGSTVKIYNSRIGGAATASFTGCLLKLLGTDQNPCHVEIYDTTLTLVNTNNNFVFCESSSKSNTILMKRVTLNKEKTKYGYNFPWLNGNTFTIVPNDDAYNYITNGYLEDDVQNSLIAQNSNISIIDEPNIYGGKLLRFARYSITFVYEIPVEYVGKQMCLDVALYGKYKTTGQYVNYNNNSDLDGNSFAVNLQTNPTVTSFIVTPNKRVGRISIYINNEDNADPGYLNIGYVRLVPIEYMNMADKFPTQPNLLYGNATIVNGINTDVERDVFIASPGISPIHVRSKYFTLSQPANKTIGTTYYDTNLKKFSHWDGTKWADGAGYTLAANHGTTANRPTLTSTDAGFTYWDTTLGKMIAWNGSAWVDSSSIKNTSTIPATGLLPNVVYNYGTTDTVSVTLAAGDAGVANIWCFVFTAQTAACTVTLPSGVVLGNEYAWDMVAGRRYEVSIMDNVAIVNYSD